MSSGDNEQLDDGVIPQVTEEGPSLLKRGLAALLVALFVGGLFYAFQFAPAPRAEAEDATRFATGGGQPQIPDEVEPEPEPPAPPVAPSADAEKKKSDLWFRIKSPLMIVTTSQSQTLPGDPTLGGESLNPYDALAKAMHGINEPGPAPDPYAAFQEQVNGTTIATAFAVQMENLDMTVLAGTAVCATLETAIQSGLPGPVRAVTCNDVYAARGRAVMIPTGSQLYGSVQGTVQQGQTRAFIVWQRVVTPQGVAIAPGSIATGPLGRAGLGGHVDYRFWQRLGNAVLLSVIGIATDDIRGRYAQAAGDAFQDQADDALDDGLNLPPVLHIDQGARLTVLLQRDLDFTGVYRRASP